MSTEPELPKPPRLTLLERATLAGYRLALPLLQRPALRKLAQGVTPAFRDQAEARAAERLGHLPAGLATGSLLIHGASVGEILAARPLIEALLARPDMPKLTVTTLTATGSEQVLKLFGERVQHCFLPFDRPAAVARFVDVLQPRGIVLLETEIWPNLLLEAARRAVPVTIANGRLSPGNFANYRRIRPLVAPALRSVARVLCQSDADRDRFLALGARDALVVGNVKFDLEIGADTVQRAARLRESLNPDNRAWLAASTHEGEETVALESHRSLQRDFPGALLVLAPRHPQRFDAVAQQVIDAGLTLQRTSDPNGHSSADVLLVDRLGELLAWYGAVPVSFVGGSLVAKGGHNPIEPALMASAILTGPSRDNFAFVYPELLDAGGALEVDGAHELAGAVAELWRDEPRRQSMCAAAKRVVEENRGALPRTITQLVRGLAVQSR